MKTIITKGLLCLGVAASLVSCMKDDDLTKSTTESLAALSEETDEDGNSLSKAASGTYTDDGVTYTSYACDYNSTGKSCGTASGWTVNMLSSDIQIASKTNFNIRFTCLTVGTSNWNTPDFYLYSKSGSTTTLTACARTDNHIWNDNASRESLCTMECNWDWNTFLSVVTKSYFNVNITNKGNGYCDIHMTITGSDGNSYYQNYLNIPCTANSLYFRLTGDSNAWTGVFKKALSSKSYTSGYKALSTVSWAPNATYPDDYRSISSWSNVANWNLGNVHDPSICYYNGKYYMWCTDASFGNEHLNCTTGCHFPGKVSSDLVKWSWCNGPFQSAPSWVLDTINAQRKRLGLSSNLTSSDISWNYWAPCVRVVNGKIRMYYSIGPSNTYDFTSSTWCMPAYIGMCETTNPEGGPSAWTDKGYVTSSFSDKGSSFYKVSNTSYSNASYYVNGIDPTYIITSAGKHYLIYGSWHSGFACLELNSSTGKPTYNSGKLGELYGNSVSDITARYGKRICTRTTNSRWQGSEAPEVIYKDGYYYMFMAWDELSVAYNTRVVRATSVEGPYYTSRGTEVTNGLTNDKFYPIVTHPYKFKDGYGWVGISHCCVFQNQSTGDWMYASQQRLPNISGDSWAPNANMLGGVRKLVWCPSTGDVSSTDLWPIALPERYAATENHNSTAITKSDICGHYEFITLGYNYGTQDEPATNYLLFKGDGTYSCEGVDNMAGTWTYNSAKKYIVLTSTSGKFPGSSNSLKTMILCVERELDWEKQTESIVFAGFHKNNTCTFWGKKVANFTN